MEQVVSHWAITGGTGFLGIHILRELLREPETITLLTRPQSDPVARIQKALALAATNGQVWTNEQLRERLAVVSVDLAEPNLGLTDERFQALATALTQSCIAPRVPRWTRILPRFAG